MRAGTRRAGGRNSRTPDELRTSSVAHLRDNVAAAALELPADAVAELDAIG